FVVWVNMDGWFVLGLAVVALVWLGQALDAGRRPQGDGPPAGPGRFAFVVPLAVLAAGCLLNPAPVPAFALPPALAPLGPASGPVASPVERAYFAHVGLSAAGLAYFPLLALSLLSFLLDLPGWSWRRFLPWLALVLLSAVQARAVPFFAVVAGPVLAWNLHA